MDRYTITLYPAQLNGKKTTSKGKAYFEVVGQDKKKYRIYDEGLYNRLTVGQSVDVSISEYSDSFVNDKGATVDYTLYTIHNIEGMSDVPLSDDEPLDKAIAGGIQAKDYEKPSHKTVTTSTQPISPDWDAIARGKVRNSVAVAFIGQKIDFDEEAVKEMEKWVDWIMEG